MSMFRGDQRSHLTVRRVGVASVTATAALLAPSAPSIAAEPPSDDHCVLHIEGQKASGEFEVGDPVCFGTLAEALAEAGADVDSSDRQLRMDDVATSDLASNSSGLLAIHFDGTNRSGASITISGSLCTGGWLNLSSAWVNRISSTFNTCNTTTFFDGFNLTGAADPTGLSAVDLKGIPDAANSVQYA